MTVQKLLFFILHIACFIDFEEKYKYVILSHNKIFVNFEWFFF